MPAWILVFVVAFGIGYGYWDAYHEREIDGDIRARIVNSWSVYPDTLEANRPLDNGQVWVSVMWNQPNGARISSIHIEGAVERGGQPIARFNAPCLRFGRPWLGDLTTDRECFVKVDHIVKSTANPNEPVHWDEANTLIVGMSPVYSAEVKAVNKPMRFVTWINEQLSAAYEILTTPFKRE